MNNITKLQSLCERNACACACACVFSNWCVLRVCRRDFEKMTLFWLTDLDEKKVTIEGDSGLSLASVRTFSWLVGPLLVVGLCANVYLVRVTARRRFPRPLGDVPPHPALLECRRLVSVHCPRLGHSVVERAAPQRK